MTTIQKLLLFNLCIFAVAGAINIAANFFGYYYNPLAFWQAVFR